MLYKLKEAKAVSHTKRLWTERYIHQRWPAFCYMQCKKRSTSILNLLHAKAGSTDPPCTHYTESTGCTYVVCMCTRVDLFVHFFAVSHPFSHGPVKKYGGVGRKRREIIFPPKLLCTPTHATLLSYNQGDPCTEIGCFYFWTGNFRNKSNTQWRHRNYVNIDPNIPSMKTTLLLIISRYL